MFSKTCEYAIRATIFIATESQKGSKIGMKEIANQIDSPEAFTAKILQKLVKNTIVDSSKGVGGGFFIDETRLNKVKLIDIIEAIEGSKYLNGCALGLNQCSESHPCPFHHIYKPIKENILKEINTTSLKDLVITYQKGLTFLKE